MMYVYMYVLTYVCSLQKEKEKNTFMKDMSCNLINTEREKHTEMLLMHLIGTL